MVLGRDRMLGLIRDLGDTNDDFEFLADKVMDWALPGVDSTRGHVNHALGVCQVFLKNHPQHVAIIKNSSTSESFHLRDPNHSTILSDWLTFLASKSGSFGPSNEYDYDTQRNILPTNLGGHVVGGGGGGDEFKTVLRLVAELI